MYPQELKYQVLTCIYHRSHERAAGCDRSHTHNTDRPYAGPPDVLTTAPFFGGIKLWAVQAQVGGGEQQKIFLVDTRGRLASRPPSTVAATSVHVLSAVRFPCAGGSEAIAKIPPLANEASHRTTDDDARALPNTHALVHPHQL
jgi:hypothetical protein